MLSCPQYFILNLGLTRYLWILWRNFGSILFVLQTILPRYCIIINALQRHKNMLSCPQYFILNLGLTRYLWILITYIYFNCGTLSGFYVAMTVKFLFSDIFEPGRKPVFSSFLLNTKNSGL